MKNTFIVTLLMLSLTLLSNSCKRGAGQGGSSEIKGRIYQYNVNLNFTSKLDSGWAQKQDVYLIYGDDVTFSDDQKTNFDGSYNFKYLRKGKYKVFTYSDDSSQAVPFRSKAVVRELEITKNKQTVELDSIVVWNKTN